MFSIDEGSGWGEGGLKGWGCFLGYADFIRLGLKDSGLKSWDLARDLFPWRRGSWGDYVNVMARINRPAIGTSASLSISFQESRLSQTLV